MTLKNPLVVSASPLSEEVGNIRRMEDSGASAVVLPSLFEEQIQVESNTLDHFLWQGTESFAESLTYMPDMAGYKLGPDGYLEHLRSAKQAVKIPVIGSLNGVSTGGWVGYAKKIEEAGADALELNIYFIPTDAEMSGAHVEQMYVDLVAQVKASIHIPVAVKIGAYFSSLPNMAKRLDQAGANALVLFNRFYQPDFDLEALEVVPNLILSTPHELLLRLNWVAVLYGKIKADLAITGGVHSGAGRAEVDDGRSKRGHDDLGIAPERHRPPGDRANRTSEMDGRTRIRIHPSDARQHESAGRGGPLRLPEGELRQGAEFVCAGRR